MAYLQITTKCNHRCPHCCYSCTMRGKHGDYSTIIDAIAFARNQDDSGITIGGGEPTLHPLFFGILECCLNDFDYVWMATNGSQTKSMYRLANIINGCDYKSFECEDYCTCGSIDGEDCYCEPDYIYQENKLTVALSQDHFHDDIDSGIVDLWKRNANKHRHTGFEIRNISNDVQAQGRAKKTGSGWGEHCVCSDLLIRPDGKIKLCGCTNSPIIGDIWSGISDKYEKIISSDKWYNADEQCWNSIKRGK